MKIRITNNKRLAYDKTLKARMFNYNYSDKINKAYMVTDGYYKWSVYDENEVEVIKPIDTFLEIIDIILGFMLYILLGYLAFSGLIGILKIIFYLIKS